MYEYEYEYKTERHEYNKNELDSSLIRVSFKVTSKWEDFECFSN